LDKKKIIFIIITVLSVLAVILTYFSVCITRKIEDSSYTAQSAAVVDLNKQDIQQKESLAPSRPEDYGMIVIEEGSAPKTQGEWDNLLAGKIKESKAMLSAEDNKKMRAVIEEDPKKTAEKMKQIDEGIKKCNEALKADPNNQQIKDKLTRYMMLKSIGKELSQE